jgi:hypothetical protein
MEFTLIPELPTEIRLKIWNAACFVPRIFEIERDGEFVKRYAFSSEGDRRLHKTSRLASNSWHPDPTLFSVCSKSQQEAKKAYK